MKIKELKENTFGVDIFLMIKEISQRETSSKKPFVNFVLSDGVDNLNAKMWNVDIANLNLKTGDIIKIRGDVAKWQDALQLIIKKIRLADKSTDNFNEDDFVKTSPIDENKVFNYFIETAKKFESPTLKAITINILEKHKDTLLYFPGAKSVHHAEKKGLIYHMYRMLLVAQNLKNVYNFNLNLLEAGVILHDIGKIYELDSDKNGVVSDYTVDGELFGHLIMGIKEIDEVVFNLKQQGANLNHEDIRNLEHMIASHHGKIEYGAIKTPMFLEAQLLNDIDLIDSKTFIFEDIEGKLEDGQLSDKQFALQSKVYKPKNI